MKIEGGYTLAYKCGALSASDLQRIEWDNVLLTAERTRKQNKMGNVLHTLKCNVGTIDNDYYWIAVNV